MRLYIKTTFFILLSLLLGWQLAYSQEVETDSSYKVKHKRFSVNIQGGVSFVRATDGLGHYPLYTKKPAGSAAIELRYDLHPKNYVFVQVAHHFLQLDAIKASHQLLIEDTNTQGVSLKSDGVGITQFGLGWGNRFCITEDISIGLAPVVGVSLLHLPDMVAEIDTQPYTTLKYRSTTNLSFYFGAYASVSYQLVDDFFLELNLAYTQSKHDIKPKIDSNQPQKAKAWSYQLFTTSAGFTYRLF